LPIDGIIANDELLSILEREGKKQQKIIRFCFRMIRKKDLDEELKLSYVDRLLKAGKKKLRIIRQIKDLDPSFGLDEHQL